MSWSCQYEVKGSCKRLKRDCRPGMKGCVLDQKAEFISFETDEKEVQAMAEKVEILDLRQMPPFQRHEKIFQTWDALKPGEALKIINDHDPKPLWYQFEVEYKDKYAWEYEQKGPKDWIVKISKK
ncbi:MAG: DUF2249 domain-containing protein [Candidatus Omnitrophota bacterium]